MKRNNDAAQIAGDVFKFMGTWLLKAVGFCLWVTLSAISILLRSIVDYLKSKLFKNE